MCHFTGKYYYYYYYYYYCYYQYMEEACRELEDSGCFPVSVNFWQTICICNNGSIERIILVNSQNIFWICSPLVYW